MEEQQIRLVGDVETLLVFAAGPVFDLQQRMTPLLLIAGFEAAPTPDGLHYATIQRPLVEGPSLRQILRFAASSSLLVGAPSPEEDRPFGLGLLFRGPTPWARYYEECELLAPHDGLVFQTEGRVAYELTHFKFQRVRDVSQQLGSRIVRPAGTEVKLT
jgi:hypothetical protein